MAGNPTTRSCEACGQLWSSARFLDPTIEEECGLCGGRLVRVDLSVSEFAHPIERAEDQPVSGQHVTNGAGSPVAPLR